MLEPIFRRRSGRLQAVILSLCVVCGLAAVALLSSAGLADPGPQLHVLADGTTVFPDEPVTGTNTPACTIAADAAGGVEATGTFRCDTDEQALALGIPVTSLQMDVQRIRQPT